ncbi:fimbrillin family protein, partial [Phocaeicola plebeius]|uniref:fimbrillin family protein n=1 Tax=Phocaeicola plebeius TaxID=310297 RepID=UPI003FF111CA
MKRYFMKSSVMLMAVSAALASCTQDEMVKKEVSTHQALNISVTTQDFVSEDGSRATTGTDAGRITVFAEGDAMGMYVISSDGTVICNNEKFVYTESAWKAENELYYW